jgi:hypothetical protein
MNELHGVDIHNIICCVIPILCFILSEEQNQGKN